MLYMCLGRKDQITDLKRLKVQIGFKVNFKASLAF